jgi:hypothetical protein
MIPPLTDDRAAESSSSADALMLDVDSCIEAVGDESNGDMAEANATAGSGTVVSDVGPSECDVTSYCEDLSVDPITAVGDSVTYGEAYEGAVL